MHAKVLLIDDSKFLRAALERTLAGDGFEVRVAGDFEAGLRLAQTEGKFDLILLDLFQPRMTGDEMLKRIKQNPVTADIPVMVLNRTTCCLPKETLDLMAAVASMEQLYEAGASHTA